MSEEKTWGEHTIETFTGGLIDISDPQPEQVHLEDVAHALANVCRFGGHARHFYSVAEHAVLCSWYARKKWSDPVIEMAALHHDDPEAYLGDVPRPIKQLLGPAYVELTKLMEKAINLGLPLDAAVVSELHSPEVKESDNWALVNEAGILLPSRGEGWETQADSWDLDVNVDPVAPPSTWVAGLGSTAAERLWLNRHNELEGRLG